jgi:hypothetical protein
LARYIVYLTFLLGVAQKYHLFVKC